MDHLPVYSPLYNKLLTGYLTCLHLTGYSAASHKGMLSPVREFFYRMELKGVFHIKDLTPTLIREHYLYLKERPNYRRPGKISLSHVNHHMYSLKTFMGHLEKTGIITSNPLSALCFPRAHYPQRQVLSPTDIGALYGASECFRDRAMLSLFYGCGLRREEVVKLTITDTRLGSLLLYVRSGKGRRRRVVPLSHGVASDLKNYLARERNGYLRGYRQSPGAFMINNRGNGANGRWLWLRLKYLASLAGLSPEISLHHLRHSIATHLLEGGLTIEQVRDFLGHSFLETTQIYTRVSALALAKAAI